MPLGRLFSTICRLKLAIELLLAATRRYRIAI
jgi:hypothetical protein